MTSKLLKRTILQINVDANNGSNGSIARDIGDLVLQRGWNSYIAYGRKHIPSNSTLIRIGNDWDVIWHGVESRLFDNHGLSSRLSTKHFLQKIDLIKPDIIHLHNIHGYYINYKYLFEYIISRNVPVVWTLHDCWPFTGHCSHPTSTNCEKYSVCCSQCPQKTAYPKSIFIDKSNENYRLKKRLFLKPNKMIITTVSKWLQRVTNNSFLAKFPIEVIYDGIDTDSFAYRKSNLKKDLNIENKFVLMAAAANWSKSKGWDDYIKLSSILPDNMVIVLVGINDSNRQGLPSNIIPIPRQESKVLLAEYYSMADVLLNLSYAETFGMTTAEALSCGTPGISYNVTACPEVLSEDTGVIVDAGNINGLLDAIRLIQKNGKDYYSKACRRRVMDNFDFKKVNKKFLNIYDNLLEK